MSRHRYAPSSAPSGFKVKPWIGALVIALASPAAVQAAVLGHSRLASALGQPLRIDIQVSQLSPDERNSLTARPAAAADWAAAGLTPPVDLSSLRVSIIDGYAPGTRIIRVDSSQAFNGALADLLLDVGSASGSQRYQVSLLTQGGAAPASAASSSAAQSGAATGAVSTRPQSIRVRRGDTMFSIAARHAVKGVTVYQMMMALQRANPLAFIDGNINLVKAGATLVVPGMEELTALSDREARRQFVEQTQAFAAYRQRAAASAGEVGDSTATASGAVTAGGEAPAHGASGQGRDQLRLSGKSEAGNGDAADSEAALRANIGESAERVSQLEENVKHLNQALQAQGGAASNLVVEGARTLTDTLAAAAGASSPEPSTGSAPPSSEGSQEGSPQDASGRKDSGGNLPGKDGSGNAPGVTQAGGSQAADGGSQAASPAQPAAEGDGAAATGERKSAGNDKGIQSASDASSSGSSADTQAGVGAAPPASNPGSGETTAARDTDSTKAGQTVSWFQEHALGVITGVLALIVLIIAWLLRRANASRGDGRDGVITEAMVQEKLNEINLDLGDGPGDKAR